LRHELGTSGAKALNEEETLIAALKALRHPKALRHKKALAERKH
jgi:hypothetical protein